MNTRRRLMLTLGPARRGRQLLEHRPRLPPCLISRARPADILVEEPDGFELVANLNWPWRCAQTRVIK